MARQHPKCLSAQRAACVPHPDHRGCPLPTEYAERGRREREERAPRRFELKPASRQHAEQMPVREQGRVAVEVAQLRNHGVDPGADSLRGLAARTAVAPERPGRAPLADLVCLEPFVLAVVPLDQLGAPLRLVREPGKAAGVYCALERARKNMLERALGEPAAKQLALLPPVVGQRDVGLAGVLTGNGPLRLAVPDEDDLGTTRTHVRRTG